MRLLSDKELNTIRGKAMVGRATTDEILSVFGHLDELEWRLDDLDMEDAISTEGWRHYFGIPGAD